MNNRIMLIFVFAFLFIAGIMIFDAFIKQELVVNYSAVRIPESREMGIQITVSDKNNALIQNAEVHYEQIDQGFMYNVGEYWDTGAIGAGSNTQGIYLDWDWGKLEPQDGIYNWKYLENTGIVNSLGELNSKAEHVYMRLGVMATSAWIVGEKMDSFTETGYPVWINQSNLTQVKEKYLEFTVALLNHLKFKPDFYMIEVEINALGINAGMTNQEIIAWLEQLTNKIKEIDPTSKVSIVVTSGDLSPFMDAYRTDNEELVKGDRFPLKVTDFLERMNGVNYDIITTLIQPFGWMSKGDRRDVARFLDSLSNFNKSVYIGWVSFLSEEPKVPEELNPNPNNIYGEEGFVYYPGNQSEEWQKDQTLNLMNYIVSNPRIIGVHWDMLDYVETGTGGKNFTVKLATGFTKGYRENNGDIIEGEKRQVYNPMKELWQSLFSKGTLKSNENGVIQFNGFSGKYKITVSHPNYKTEEIIIKI